MIENTIMQSFEPNILCNCRDLSLPQEHGMWERT